MDRYWCPVAVHQQSKSDNVLARPQPAWLDGWFFAIADYYYLLPPSPERVRGLNATIRANIVSALNPLDIYLGRRGS